MCGKAQRDGRPAVELIETLVLLFASCDQSILVQRHFSINKIMLQ